MFDVPTRKEVSLFIYIDLRHAYEEFCARFFSIVNLLFSHRCSPHPREREFECTRKQMKPGVFIRVEHHLI